ncbi:MAG: hypothetical protein SCARUB_04521 [Candidatus Scalindua rubra]|uniref:Uncharacterized protein n=1 Tax=Candidatus Scalindua rubra TaxID=1872076 RepID=A0A1E3X486_9BACT|nr:MAG: hypothetical protein SCARUB_04521 [Candidatus Scalindua rubra]
MNRPNMIPCASCGVRNNILSRQQEKEFTCYNCGEDLQKAIEKYDKLNKTFDEKSEHSSSPERIDAPTLNQEKYPALRTISGIYNFLAWIMGLGALVAVFYGMSLLDRYGTKEFGIAIIMISLIGGFIGVVSLLAISEGIRLFVNIAKDVNKLKRNRHQ